MRFDLVEAVGQGFAAGESVEDMAKRFDRSSVAITRALRIYDYRSRR
ncbi:MAG: hypothetical protein ACK49G_02935 [Brevundimonas sp.]|jgi:hypothetical protein